MGETTRICTPSDLSHEDFVGLDDSVVATDPALFVDGIIESLQDSTEVMDLSLFVESYGIRSSIVNVSKFIERELSSHLRQAIIHDYFHKD